ncbi:MAG: hypothetical protein MUC88_21385 [Planctomycetes bacterium]|nr:hypothetical protein [Planctomycetota bacterium]
MMKRSRSSRRHFIETAVGVTVAARFPHVATSGTASAIPIRIGVIGCGGRGTGAALEALQAATNVTYPMDTCPTEDAAEGARAAARGVRIVVLGEHPVRAFARGGRQVRTEPRFGNIYDHLAVEYQYAGGVRCFAMDRQMRGCVSRVEEVFLGPKGAARFGLFRGWGNTG